MTYYIGTLVLILHLTFSGRLLHLQVSRYDQSALVWSCLAPHKNVSLEKQNVLFCVPVMIGIVMFQDG